MSRFTTNRPGVPGILRAFLGSNKQRCQRGRQRQRSRVFEQGRVGELTNQDRDQAGGEATGHRLRGWWRRRSEGENELAAHQNEERGVQQKDGDSFLDQDLDGQAEGPAGEPGGIPLIGGGGEREGGVRGTDAPQRVRADQVGRPFPYPDASFRASDLGGVPAGVCFEDTWVQGGLSGEGQREPRQCCCEYEHGGLEADGSACRHECAGENAEQDHAPKDGPGTRQRQRSRDYQPRGKGKCGQPVPSLLPQPHRRCTSEGQRQ